MGVRGLNLMSENVRLLALSMFSAVIVCVEDLVAGSKLCRGFLASSVPLFMCDCTLCLGRPCSRRIREIEFELFEKNKHM